MKMVSQLYVVNADNEISLSNSKDNNDKNSLSYNTILNGGVLFSDY